MQNCGTSHEAFSQLLSICMHAVTLGYYVLIEYSNTALFISHYVCVVVVVLVVVVVVVVVLYSN